MSQTGKDKPIVFLSHADEDAAIASEIKAWLEQNLLDGVEVFVSSDKGLDPGEEWEHVILEKLQNCSIELVVCTQMSVGRRWVNIEIGGAWVRGVKIIPLCYHDQSTETLPRPLSSRQALDLSEPSDVRKLLKVTAKEAGLSAPDIDPNELIERLPSRNYEALIVDGGLPDIRVGVTHLAMVYGGGGVPHCISINARNHDKNSVFIKELSIAIKGSTNRLIIPTPKIPTPNVELKPGDSIEIDVNPDGFKLEGDLRDLEQLGEVIFLDKIGRKFKGSAEDTLKAIQAWKSETQSDKK